MSTHEDIHELFRRVREHPDFVFGAIFAREDFECDEGDLNPDLFPVNVAEDALASKGNELIDDLGTPDESERNET